MIHKEKQAHLYSIPLYYLKFILKRIFKINITPLKIAPFDQYKAELLEFDFGKKIKVKSFRPENHNDLSPYHSSVFHIKEKLNDSKVRVLNNHKLTVYGLEGIVANRNGEILIDHYYGNSFNSDKIKKTGYISRKYHVQYMMGEILIPKKTIDIDKAVIVTTRWSENYYHWFNYVLPKLKAIDALNLNTINVVINKLRYNFQKESLRLLFPHVNLIETEKNQKIIVDDAYLPETSPAVPQKRLYLKNKIHDDNSKRDVKLYISRQKSRNRKLINHEEALKILEKFGFKEVYFENVSFEDQIELINSAKIIVSPHGAGLNNLMFAKNNPILIELLPYRRVHIFKHYFKLSASLNLKYYCLIDSKKRYFRNRKNIHVDLLKLEKLLTDLTIGEKKFRYDGV